MPSSDNAIGVQQRQRSDRCRPDPSCRLWRLLLMSWLLLAGMVHAGSPDPYLFESSAPGNAGGGLALNGAHLHGHTFRVEQRVQVSAIGGQFSAHTAASIFGALYSLGTPVSRPQVLTDANLLATTLVDIPGGGAIGEFSGDLDITLEPGWYAVGFGTGRHGATATGFNVSVNATGNPKPPQTHGPWSVMMDTGNLILQATTPRYVVRGVTLDPEPVDPTTFVFETARPWSWWGASTVAINSGHFNAQRFTLSRPTRIDRVSTWLYGPGGHGTVFAAIFPLAGANANPPTPQHPQFEQLALASTVLSGPPTTEEVHADFDNVELPPGHYALVLGSGHFGASGERSMLNIADAVVIPGTLRLFLPQSPVWLYINEQTFSMRLSGHMPELASDTRALDFGDVLVDDLSSHTVTVSNWRDHDTLAISSMQLLGVDAGQFILGDDAAACSTLAIGASCSFTVQYRPQADGPHQATLSISSDGVPSPLDIELDGNGLPSAWVTPVAGDHGGIQPDMPQLAGLGTTLAFTLAPDTGYHVDNVDSSCGGSLDGLVFTTAAINADCAVTAAFAINLYPLDYDAGEHGSIGGDALQSVPHGGDGTPVTVVADTGYHFVQWSDGRNDNPRTDTAVTGPLSVQARYAINTYTLEYGVVAHGSIDGDATQSVAHGGDGTPVTAVPDTGYHFLRWSDLREDNPRVDSDVAGNLSVNAEFEINTYTVTASAEGNGVVTPSGDQTVEHGSSTGFQVVPDPGHVAVVDGSCGGELVGTTYNTEPVTADCTVVVTFAAPVTLHAIGGSGQQAPLGTDFEQPLRVQVLDLDGDPVADVAITFQAPASGASTLPAQATAHTGSDGIALLQVRANMSAGSYIVQASAGAFPAAAAVTFDLDNRLPVATLVADVSDDRDYARYGQLVDYQVQVHNSGPDPVAGLDIDMTLSDSLDVAAAQWQCLTPATGCTVSGTGELHDSGLHLAVGDTVTYQLGVPVHLHPGQPLTTADVDVQAPGLQASASDTSILVIMRNGFNSADDDGAQQTPWLPKSRITARITPAGDGEVVLIADAADVGDGGDGDGIVTLWRSAPGEHPALRIDRLQHDTASYLRLVASGTNGDEHASAWIVHNPDASILLGRFRVAGHSGAMLSSGPDSVELLLPDIPHGQ